MIKVKWMPPFLETTSSWMSYKTEESLIVGSRAHPRREWRSRKGRFVCPSTHALASSVTAKVVP
jgi:hypothetical protein